MRYIKILFTKGLKQNAYQEIDNRGICVRLLDENGEELIIPDGLVTESKVVSEDADEIKQAIKTPYAEPDSHACSFCGNKCTGK